MKHKFFLSTICVVFTILSLMSGHISGQSTGVFAEAVGQANLRSRPDVNSDLVGEIASGTRYPVIGRSEFYPWVLLGEQDTEQPMGWVFDQLVTVYGNIFVVPLSSVDVSVPPTPTLTPLVTDVPGATEDPATTDSGPVITPFSTVTWTPTPTNRVMGTASGDINLRYGPGVEYPSVGRAGAGDAFEVTGYHTQFPWYQIRYDGSPNGFAWVAEGLLELQGDIYSLEPATSTSLSLPTLTPTAAIRQSVGVPGAELVDPSPQFLALGDRMWDLILEADFVPGSRRFGAVYLQDMQTGEAITFGNEMAFSGTSINKIAVLAQYFAFMNGQPNLPEAVDIANTMICSENVATNRLIGLPSGGDQLEGAEGTTRLLQFLGLTRTFLTAPYEIPSTTPATPPPRAIRVPTTTADQVSANPNPTNQMTVEEMGWLLSSIYQCAYQEDGPLIDDFDGAFTPQECRKILYVMSNNTVDALLKAGVPADIPVAHKHGWINDTHGNAAVFFTPGGDYVMVMMLFQPEWLNFTESLPLIAEVSRTVYNYYNPTQPLQSVRDGYIPTVEECNYAADSTLVNEIASPFFLDALESGLFFSPTLEATPDSNE